MPRPPDFRQQVIQIDKQVRLPPEFIANLEKQFGFDKPPLERYALMLWNYARFDFGESWFRSISVVDLVLEKMPVSITLGLWSTLLAYLISIPLGIRKAVRDGTAFDTWTSSAIIVGYAIPSFLFAVLLIVVFAGGRYFDLFPLRGLVSDNWASLPWWQQILDYAWHMVLPLTALVIGAFAITSDPIIIALGLGFIGAMFVRSMTIYLVRAGTLSEYRYLEHGAHWAIGALAVILLLSIEFHINDIVTGLIGVVFISAALFSSVVANRRDQQRARAGGR